MTATAQTAATAEETRTYDAVVAAWGRNIRRPERWLLARIRELRGAGYTYQRIVEKLAPPAR